MIKLKQILNEGKIKTIDIWFEDEEDEGRGLARGIWKVDNNGITVACSRAAC